MKNKYKIRLNYKGSNKTGPVIKEAQNRPSN